MAFILIPTLIFFTSTLGIQPMILNPPSTSKIPMGQGSSGDRNYEESHREPIRSSASRSAWEISFLPKALVPV